MYMIMIANLPTVDTVTIKFIYNYVKSYYVFSYCIELTNNHDFYFISGAHE